MAAPDDDEARALLGRACDLGDADACEDAASRAAKAGRLKLAAARRERAIALRDVPAKPTPDYEPKVVREPHRLHALTIAGGAQALVGWLVGIVGFFASTTSGCYDFSVDYSGFGGSGRSNAPPRVPCRSTSGWLLVPQLGPWLALATHSVHDGWVGASVALGVVQLAGLAAMLCGVAVKTPRTPVAIGLAPNGVTLSASF